MKYSVHFDHMHHMIHNGRAYSLSGTTALNDKDTYALHLVTPNTGARCHLRGEITCTQPTTVVFLEAPTITANGTAMTPVCRRLDEYEGTAAMLAYHTPTYSGGGTIFYGAFGASRDYHGLDQDHEWILAPNEDYVLNVTSGANANTVTFELDWYEHDEAWYQNRGGLT